MFSYEMFDFAIPFTPIFCQFIDYFIPLALQDFLSLKLISKFVY